MGIGVHVRGVAHKEKPVPSRVESKRMGIGNLPKPRPVRSNAKSVPSRFELTRMEIGLDGFIKPIEITPVQSPAVLAHKA